MKPIVLGPAESRAIEGHPAQVKASSEDCDERFCVLESVIDVGSGPPMHVHNRHLEAMYVLEGVLEILAGRDTVRAPPGSFVLAPPGSPHTFSNPGPGPARFLGFAAPGGIDRFLAGLGAILGRPGPPDTQALGELLQRFDYAVVRGDLPDGPSVSVLGPGEGDTLTILGNTIAYKAEAADTSGALGLIEYTAAPGFPGPLLHLHRELVEMFFVLEGELAMRLGDETFPAPAGSFVFVPPATAHAFSNPGTEPARFLSLVSPGGLEQYFRDLVKALGDGPQDSAVMTELMLKYDTETVGAPER
jgi:mannose-6-phosphate isomerase-like protein (cupin superfamily)